MDPLYHKFTMATARVNFHGYGFPSHSEQLIMLQTVCRTQLQSMAQSHKSVSSQTVNSSPPTVMLLSLFQFSFQSSDMATTDSTNDSTSTMVSTTPPTELFAPALSVDLTPGTLQKDKEAVVKECLQNTECNTDEISNFIMACCTNGFHQLCLGSRAVAIICLANNPPTAKTKVQPRQTKKIKVTLLQLNDHSKMYPPRDLDVSG